MMVDRTNLLLPQYILGAAIFTCDTY